MDLAKLKSLNNICILAVDDHSFMASIMKQSLAAVGIHDVKYASSGEEALKILKMYKFDLLITDINMPGINGLILLQKIRTGDAGVRRDLPVIMLTGYSNSDVLRYALQLDVSGFLVKPASTKKIAESMYTAIAHKIDLYFPDYYRKVRQQDVALPAKRLKQSQHSIRFI